MSEEDKGRTAGARLALRLTRHFAAPPDAVFRAWTDPKAFAQWIGPPGVQARDVRVDLRVGGGYSLVLHGDDSGPYPLSGEYREIDRPRRLVFTFVWGHGDLAGLEMLVSLDLIAERGGTRMEFLQEQVPSASARDRHEEGWSGSFARLERLLGPPKD